MNFNRFHKIISPVYFNLTAIILYYVFRGMGNFIETYWNTYIFNFLLFIFPAIIFVWILHRFRKSTIKKNNRNTFLITLVPGFPIGAFIGYGFWEMAHGSGILYLLITIVLYGIPTSLITGILGICINFFLPKK